MSFPKYTSGAVTRIIDRQAAEYTKLANAFARGEFENVRNIAGQELFTTVRFSRLQGGHRLSVQDFNRGLVDRLIASVTGRRVLALRQTYSRLRLSDLAGKAGLSSPNALTEIHSIVNAMVRCQRGIPITHAPDLFRQSFGNDCAFGALPDHHLSRSRLFSKDWTKGDRPKPRNDPVATARANHVKSSHGTGERVAPQGASIVC